MAWGGRGASGAQGGPDYGGCWQGTRGAHVKHVLHVCDAGSVEAQRLVERPRVLPSQKGSVGRGVTCRAGRREGLGGGSNASNVQGEPNYYEYEGCWQGTREAHVKHSPHVCDAGGVEAQRLVER